jgi:hypothetical protein
LELIPQPFIKLFDEYLIVDLHLSLTQGFWWTKLWGQQKIGDEVPVGVELAVEFVENKNVTRFYYMKH